MLPDTPQQWFALLYERLQSERGHIERLDQYLRGEPPLPEPSTSAKADARRRAALLAYQRRARANYAELIVDAIAERMDVAGFTVGGEGGDNDLAREVWTDSWMPAFSADVHRDALAFGRGYTMVDNTDDGPVITREDPRGIAVDLDPLRPGRVRAALKVWTDGDVEHARLHLPGRMWAMSGDAGRLSVDGVAPVGTGLPVVPVFVFDNRDRKGEFETHLGLLDRINKGILDRLLIAALQVFRQRGIKEPEDGLPDKNPDGTPVNYDELFPSDPDALWLLPHGTDIWESQQVDLTPVLSATRDDVRELSALTRVPIKEFYPDGANQSAEGASFAREGLTFKCRDRVRRMTPPWRQSMNAALTLAGSDERVQVQWTPIEQQTLPERFDALTKAQDLPWRRRMTDILGYPADVVDEMENERAGDALTAALSAPVPATGQDTTGAVPPA